MNISFHCKCKYRFSYFHRQYLFFTCMYCTMT